MVYLQIEAPIENLIFGASQSGGVATKLKLTCNATHDIYESIVLDISDDPTIYKLIPVDGIGFDLTVLDPGEYHYEIFDDTDNLLVEGLISMSIIDSAEIFYDEEPLCDIIGPIPIIKLEILDEINGEVIPGGYDDKTKAILESVLAIKAAIEEKSEKVGNDPLRTYADHIRNIETSSSATITIKQGGENKGEFTLNQKNDQIIELEDGGEPHWFGARAEYDAIEVKDPDTIYHVKEPIPYDDISGKPDLKPVATTGSYDDLEDKPDLKPVATTGSYDDLEDKPDLKPIATTGDYNDLDNKPVIEPVYNSFITIMQGDKEKGKFSLNQSNNQTIEIDMGGDPHWFGTQEEYDAIPVKDPDTIYHIEGGSDDKHWFGTQGEYDAIPVKDPDMIYCIEGGGSTAWDDIQDKPDFKPVATSGNYNDLTNKPTIPSVEGLASEQWVEEQGYLTEHQDISGKVDRNELAPVATSGNYNDLTNKPTIPSVEGLASEQWVEEQGYLTEHQDISGKVDRSELAPVATSGDYEDLTNKPEIPSIEGLASEQYVGNELRKYLPLVGGTLTGHLTIGSTSETAYKKFEAIRKVNNEGNGAAFYVNSDGTAAFYHKSYSASGSAVNDAILKFDSVGLMFAMGGNRTTSATEFKKVLLEGDIPEPGIIHYDLPGFVSGTVPASLYIADFWNQKTQIENGRIIIRGGETAAMGWPITFSKIGWFEDDEERRLVIEGSVLYSANTVSVTYQQFADKDPSNDDWRVSVSQHSVTHHSENWTFELEDGSTVTKNIWLD